MEQKLEMSDINRPLLLNIAQGLGTAIFHPDASIVACSDKGERSRVKEKFLGEVLHLTDDKVNEEAVAAVCKQMGTSNRRKFRVVFYYLLTEYFGAAETILSPKAADQSEFDKLMITYRNYLANDLNMPDFDETMLFDLAQGLGTAIYHPDASLVACSDKAELKRIEENFLIGNQGLPAGPELAEAIKNVCAQMGTSNRRKQRVVFYYLLWQHFNNKKDITTAFAPAPKSKANAAKIAAAIETVNIVAPEMPYMEAPATADEVTATVIAHETTQHEPEAVVEMEPVAFIEHGEDVVETPTETVVEMEPVAFIAHAEDMAPHHEPEPISNFDQAVSTYHHYLTNDLGVTDLHEGLLYSITRELGTAIFHPDASLVACSDSAERTRIKQNFLNIRLGLHHNEQLDHAIENVCQQMGSDNRRKHRAVFYYLLTRQLGAERTILEPMESNMY
jgi:hypothetical protein